MHFGRLGNFALMASKPKSRFLHQGTLQNSSKKARTITSESSMRDAFSNYTDYLNNLNEKRERVVKASRDITMNSKKVIFQVHRISKHNRDEVLEKAERDLAAVTDQYMSRLVTELQGTDFWKLRRAYSPGVQEYIEAATFCKFCRTGTLLNLDEINAKLLPLSDPSIEPLQINILDYLLGVADLTGELMRLAIGRISDGDLEFAKKICSFVRDIYRELTLVVPYMDDSSDMKTKMDTMLQSVIKIENGKLICTSIHHEAFLTLELMLSTNRTGFYLVAFDGMSDMCETVGGCNNISIAPCILHASIRIEHKKKEREKKWTHWSSLIRLEC